MTLDRPSPVPRRVVPVLALAAFCFTLLGCGGSAHELSEPAGAPRVPVAELITQADAAYAGRADLDRVREGLKLLRSARAQEPANYEVAWRTARLAYTLGDRSKDDEERAKAFAEGVAAGKAAAAAEPQKPEGHFWLGANTGGEAQVLGPLSGLASAKELRQRMETVLRLDEDFQGGSAHMVLGRLDTELPSMLGGDVKRAIATLEQGLKYGEQNSLLRLRLAEAYLADKRKEDARRELNYLLQMKPHPDFLPEHEEATTKARELLATRFK
ncbi:MAG TPA: TRAP transporter TatT component family protein [Pyrinomonadaceae bacterium]